MTNRPDVFSVLPIRKSLDGPTPGELVAEGVGTPVPAGDQPTRSVAERGGGSSSQTMNHLVSPAPLKEWVELVQAEHALVERLARSAQDRAKLELALMLAGVTREAMDRALADAGGV